MAYNGNYTSTNESPRGIINIETNSSDRWRSATEKLTNKTKNIKKSVQALLVRWRRWRRTPAGQQVVMATIVILCVIPSIYIILPMTLGSIGICLWGDARPVHSTTTTEITPAPESQNLTSTSPVIPFSSSSAIGLALLSTALGGPMLWFARREEFKKKKNMTRKELAYVFRMERLQSVGVLFLIGALILLAFFYGSSLAQQNKCPNCPTPEIAMSADDLCSYMGCSYGWGSPSRLRCYCNEEWL